MELLESIVGYIVPSRIDLSHIVDEMGRYLKQSLLINKDTIICLRRKYRSRFKTVYSDDMIDTWCNLYYASSSFENKFQLIETVVRCCIYCFYFKISCCKSWELLWSAHRGIYIHRIIYLGQFCPMDEHDINSITWKTMRKHTIDPISVVVLVMKSESIELLNMALVSIRFNKLDTETIHRIVFILLYTCIKTSAECQLSYDEFENTATLLYDHFISKLGVDTFNNMTVMLYSALVHDLNLCQPRETLGPYFGRLSAIMPKCVTSMTNEIQWKVHCQYDMVRFPLDQLKTKHAVAEGIFKNIMLEFMDDNERLKLKLQSRFETIDIILTEDFVSADFVKVAVSYFNECNFYEQTVFIQTLYKVPSESVNCILWDTSGIMPVYISTIIDAILMYDILDSSFCSNLILQRLALLPIWNPRVNTLKAAQSIKQTPVDKVKKIVLIIFAHCLMSRRGFDDIIQCINIFVTIFDIPLEFYTMLLFRLYRWSVLNMGMPQIMFIESEEYIDIDVIPKQPSNIGGVSISELLYSSLVGIIIKAYGSLDTFKSWCTLPDVYINDTFINSPELTIDACVCRLDGNISRVTEMFSFMVNVLCSGKSESNLYIFISQALAAYCVECYTTNQSTCVNSLVVAWNTLYCVPEGAEYNIFIHHLVSSQSVLSTEESYTFDSPLVGMLAVLCNLNTIDETKRPISKEIRRTYQSLIDNAIRSFKHHIHYKYEYANVVFHILYGFIGQYSGDNTVKYLRLLCFILDEMIFSKFSKLNNEWIKHQLALALFAQFCDDTLNTRTLNIILDYQFYFYY